MTYELAYSNCNIKLFTEAESLDEDSLDFYYRQFIFKTKNEIKKVIETSRYIKTFALEWI